MLERSQPLHLPLNRHPNVGLYENLKEKIFPVEIAETPLSWEYRSIAVETAGLLMSSFTKESESFVVVRGSSFFVNQHLHAVVIEL